MKIDKLGFYRRADGGEVEILSIHKTDEWNFLAVARVCLNAGSYFHPYSDEDGEDEEDAGYHLIEFLRPSRVEWPIPRKTSFIAYLDEDCKDHFSISDVGCIYLGLRPEKPDNPPGKLYRKISKWRFYAEELLED